MSAIPPRARVRSFCPQSLDLRLEAVALLSQELDFGKQREEVGLAGPPEPEVVATDDRRADRAEVQVAVVL